MLLTSITINNTNARPSALGSVCSSVKDWVVAHPYLTYALIGAVVGTVAYLYGRPLLGRSRERAMSDPASTARVIQSNTNLRNEMERTRSALNEVRDSLVDVQLELARVNANALIELSQQGQATNAVVRETAVLLNTVNTNLVAVHETVV